jgi:hypothetical protein
MPVSSQHCTTRHAPYSALVNQPASQLTQAVRFINDEFIRPFKSHNCLFVQLFYCSSSKTLSVMTCYGVLMLQNIFLVQSVLFSVLI